VICQGEHAALLAVGRMVEVAERAARSLRQSGISCTVINARFVKPLDKETILYWARRVSQIITIEDHTLAGGFGSAVTELFSDAGLRKVRITRLGFPDRFIEGGPVTQLDELYGLTAEHICEIVSNRPFPIAAKSK
jgi:1-deoxy-D-xylulose-5-phosphate synthase